MASSQHSITLDVTKNHIAKGKPGNPFDCPVALALRAKGYRGVSVCASSANVTTRSGRDYEIAFPRRVSQFINRVDKRNRVNPRRFESGRKAPTLKPFTVTLTLKAA